MKKIMTLAAVAALVFSACAKIETIETNEAISFGAYSGNAITKAGTAGEMTTAALQTPGFGVFAYQTTGDYTSSATPNFMYNTKVYGASWTYDITKYWPNQIQAGNAGTDSQNPKALAYQADKVSFFAYGPYEAHSNASTGAVSDASYGIVGFTGNAATGDPKVDYKVSNDLDKQVDLIWGVSKGETWTNVAGGDNTPTTGFPYLDLQKPAIGTAIKFYFRHALAQLKLQAVAAYNQVNAGGTAQDGVKITIKEVVLTINGMPQTGTLNLNNTVANTPKWEDIDGSANMTFTVSGDNIATALKDGGPQKAAQQPTGVTGTAADVIINGKYYTVLPKASSTTVNVKVTYYVTTDDADLKDGYSRVENVISHDVIFADGFTAGTKNTILMKLGISEVKFDAVVEDWPVGGASETVDLPINS